MLWGGFCAAMAVFFLLVSLFHLGHTLFGWIVPPGGVVGAL